MTLEAIPSAQVAADSDRELWRDAPALSAFDDQVLRFHLGAARPASAPRLSHRNLMAENFVLHLRACTDRSGVDRLLARLRQRIEYISEPLTVATQLNGRLAGELAFASNRNVFEFGVTLFELTAQSECIEICSYWARAGQDTLVRPQRAATAGRRRQLSFQSGHRTSRVLAAGSRVIVVLGVVPKAREHNAIVSVSEAPQIRWHSDSFVEVPVSERQLVR